MIAPEFISYGLVIRAINRKLCLKQGLINRCSSPPERCSCSLGFSRVMRSVRGFMSGRELNSMLPSDTHANGVTFKDATSHNSAYVHRRPKRAPRAPRRCVAPLRHIGPFGLGAASHTCACYAPFHCTKSSLLLYFPKVRVRQIALTGRYIHRMHLEIRCKFLRGQCLTMLTYSDTIFL